MTINRRRAPTSAISSEKKKSGHKQELIYSNLINGTIIHGTQKGDVKDLDGKLHSVKSGKKWQVFLYRYDRIANSQYLNILKPCLDSFTINGKQYFTDREKCIEFKEQCVKTYGRAAAKKISNNTVKSEVGQNSYIKAKENLEKANQIIVDTLSNEYNLRNFLKEALFNIDEVDYLAIKASESNNAEKFNVFAKEDVLEIFTKYLSPASSRAGFVPEDYNVPGQKTLLCYKNNVNGRLKNIVEIEIRNDSETHYREVRFNMYSKDALKLLLNSKNNFTVKKINENLVLHGKATNLKLV